LPMNDRSLLVCGVTFPLKKSIQTELSTTIKAATRVDQWARVTVLLAYHRMS
jgi:hypothetical protein